jgi:RNA polymerase sigma factor (sigma-70 family)
MLFRSEPDQLLVAAREGDARALGALIELAGEDLRSTAERAIGRSQPAVLSAEDAYAEAMLAALRQIHALRATTYIGFRYWFATIARNRSRQALRTEQRRPDRGACVADVEEEQEAPLMITDENVGLVRNTIARLPHGQQVAFVLREGLGLAWHTIGFVLSRRSTAARLLHYRAAAGVKALGIACVDLRAVAIRA